MNKTIIRNELTSPVDVFINGQSTTTVIPPNKTIEFNASYSYLIPSKYITKQNESVIKIVMEV